MAGRRHGGDSEAIPSDPPETPMTTSLRPRTIVHVRVPHVPVPVPVPAADAPSDHGPGAAPADDTAAPGCGWYESSFALRQGLAVSELGDADGSVAALWFAALRPAAVQ
jgi:hypothetical protein